MKIFGRNIRISKVFDKSIDFLRMIIRSRIFKNRISLLKDYVSGNSKPNAVITTTDGFKIHLSSNPHDIITLMVIFCRREYGHIKPGGIVIDIGANIGLFSIYAALNGAKKVYSFEPNHQAFLTLCKSIEANGLEDVIKPFNLAVSSKDNDTLLIPRISSPYNSTKELSEVMDQRDFEEVKTISLTSILANNNIENVDLLKMDCEGAEYDILYNLSSDHFSNIRSIRLEHHKREQKDYLINFLKEHQYEKEFDHNIILWFKKQTKNVL
jgi:FkbM family methyltransferase